MLGDQSDHHHRHGAGRTGNHARAATKNGRQQAHHKGRIQSDQRIHPGHKGEGHGLRHQCQGHRQA